jgi:hypothetical protein
MHQTPGLWVKYANVRRPYGAYSSALTAHGKPVKPPWRPLGAPWWRFPAGCRELLMRAAWPGAESPTPRFMTRTGPQAALWRVF